MNLLRQARDFARSAHEIQNQKYADGPYVFHLDDVVMVLENFGVSDKTQEGAELLAAAYLHDVLEDTTVTSKTLEDLFGPAITDLVYAVTNEPGKNRKERHLATYPKIRANPTAIRLKLADRIANVQACLTELRRHGKSPKLGMYLKEHASFREALFDGNWLEMWTKLEELVAPTPAPAQLPFADGA